MKTKIMMSKKLMMSERKKKNMTFKVWDEFKEVVIPDGLRMREYFHYKK